MKKFALHYQGGALAALMLGAASAAFAQDKSVELEKIVVTSQRTGAALLQNTPMSISAFSSLALDDMKFEKLTDIARLSPSVSISNNNKAAQIYVRGVGTNLTFPGSDPSVAVFVDGVYYSNPAGLLTDLIGISGIEVLKGPQGTLYGRNAAGGVISIMTEKPGNNFSARATAEYGSYDRARFSTYIAGPIVNDKLSANLSVMQSKQDGFAKNIYVDPTLSDCQCQGNQPPRLFNGEDIQTARGSLRFTPSADLEIILKGDSYRSNYPTLYKSLYVDDRGNNLRGKVYGPMGSPAVINDPFTVSSNVSNQYAKQDINGFSGHITKDFGNGMSGKSITAYRKLNSKFRGDTDNTEIRDFVSNIDVFQKQFSQEFQLDWKTDRLAFIGGLYYFNEDNKQDAIIELPLTGALAFKDSSFASRVLAVADTDALAVFAQGTYNFTDRFHVTLGLRDSYEKKKIDRYGTLDLQGKPFATNNNNSEHASWQALTPKIGADYSLSKDALVYANVTRGFKSGGFNFSDSTRAFKPEFLWSYEAGVKSDWFGRRLRANLSAFYYDYKDLQAQAFIVTPDGKGQGVQVYNAADAKVKGLELELTARPVRHLTLTSAVAYLDTRYDKFITARNSGPTAGVSVDLAGNRLNSAPKWKFNATAQYEHQIDGLGMLSLRGEYAWQDKVYFTFFNDPSNSQSAFGTLNAFLSLASEKDRWKVSLYGRNLTDKDYITSTQNFADTGVAGSPGTPRTVGIVTELRF